MLEKRYRTALTNRIGYYLFPRQLLLSFSPMKPTIALSKTKVIYIAVAIVAFFLAVYASTLFSPSPDANVSTMGANRTVFTTANNERYEWKAVKIGGGGFVTGVTIHPTQPDRLYIRTDVGGAFRWNPQTESWVQLLRGDNVSAEISRSIESLAIAPQDPNMLYIATGAYTERKKQPVPGAVLKSRDRGETWQVLDLSIPMGGNEDWRWTGERLAVDPNNSNIVYFGSRRNGLWHTEDGGQTWRQIEPAQVPVGKPQGEKDDPAGVTYVTFDPTAAAIANKTQVIYAGVAGQGIYRTTDGGNTWEWLRGGPDRKLVPQQGVVNANQELIATFYRTKQDSRGAVWKYSPQGWQDITPEPGKNYAGVTADPNNPNRLFVLTYPMTPKQIYRSDDGGETWVTLNHRLDKLPWWPQWSFWTLSGGIAVSPFQSDRLWLTNGIGVWKTDNAGDNSLHWSAAVNGLEETVTFDAVSTPNGASLITAIADFDGFRHTSFSEFPRHNHGREVFNTTTSIDYSRGNPNFIVSVGATQHNFSVSRAGFSTDNGRNWQQFPSLENNTHPDKLVFGNVAVSATDTNNIVWQPTNSASPYYTTNRGETWQQSSLVSGQKMGGAHTHLWNPQQALAADAVRAETFYLYHHGKKGLLRTDDGGATWAMVNETLPSGVWKGANVKTAPGIAGEVWVSLKEKGLYRSVDFGEEFVRVPQVERAQVLGFGKAAPGMNHPTVYLQGEVAGARGVFRSTDLGASWVKIAETPKGYYEDARVLVGDMNAFGRVFLGTVGNGFIYGEPMNASPGES